MSDDRHPFVTGIVRSIPAAIVSGALLFISWTAGQTYELLKEKDLSIEGRISRAEQRQNEIHEGFQEALSDLRHSIMELTEAVGRLDERTKNGQNGDE